jgi:hypothetical protein
MGGGRRKFVLKPPTPKPVSWQCPNCNGRKENEDQEFCNDCTDAPPPVDPFNMYDVAMASDRVLRIKRALEAHGFEVKVETTVDVNMSMRITEPRKAKKEKA